MPSTLTYPGVYVEEIPSGTRTMTGVATSVTAFFGRTQRGPTGTPVAVSSFADFQRQFGGLWFSSPVSYAVNDFFRNGGSQALIVRLFRPAQTETGIATFTFGPSGRTLKLQAADPGTWALNLLVAVDYYPDPTSPVVKDIADGLGVAPSDLFHLTVTYFAKSGTVSERFMNLTVKDSARSVDRVLAQSSKFLRLAAGSTLATSPPDPSPTNTSEIGIRADKDAQDKTTAADGVALTQSDFGSTTFDLLDSAENVNMVCIPPERGSDISSQAYTNALSYCYKRRAILIVDPPVAWRDQAASAIKVTDLGLSTQSARNAAVYHPRVNYADPLRGGRIDEFPACGIIAGIIARTDTQRGVWKAPAGLDASLAGVTSLAKGLNDADSGFLNPQGINCLRTLAAAGQVIWGARTLRGADALSDEYKYLSVRRLALYIEESIYRGTKWAVFEPNDEPLWAQLRLNVGSFMQGLFRQGAFAGQMASDAYFVKCDKESTTPSDVNQGIVNIVVGFSPLKPAEFVVIKFQQLAGQNAA